jgi:hypothetical protein
MYMLRIAMEIVAHLKAHKTTARFCRIPSVSPSSSDKRGKATAILSKGDFTQTVDSVKALIACHVFSAFGRTVAGDSVARMKGALDSSCSALATQPGDISFTDKIRGNYRTDDNATTGRRNVSRGETNTHEGETSLDGLYAVTAGDISVEVPSPLCSCTIVLQSRVLSYINMRWEVTALVADETTMIRLDGFSLFYLTAIGCRLLSARIILTWPTQQTAHMRGGLTAGSEKR